MAILEVCDIHTFYGDAYVLQGLSLQLEQGQILGLLGRNGVGKTTLSQAVAARWSDGVASESLGRAGSCPLSSLRQSYTGREVFSPQTPPMHGGVDWRD